MLEGLLIINCYFCFGVAELGDFEYNFDTSCWGKHLQHGIILNAKVIEVSNYRSLLWLNLICRNPNVIQMPKVSIPWTE